MLHKIIKGIAPIAGIALAAALAGCGDMDVTIDGEKGVALAELDMSGDAPESLVLASSDTVVIKDGSKLDIDVTGDSDAVGLVRFTLKDGTLGVLRAKTDEKVSGTAVVNVTMPSPRSLTIAGSGTIEAESMSDKADINVLGAGNVSVAKVTATSADVNIAGSGMLTAAGSAESLDLNVMGSGSADMSGFKVETADVTVAGSGEASFASDGKVEASIVGSGTVTVIGRAKCEVSSMGSGKLVCETAAEETTEEAAPADKQAAKKSAATKKKIAKKASAKKSRKA